MYINPFVAGILCTIGAELLLLVIWAVSKSLRKEDK